MESLTETEAYQQYNEYLDELEPLRNFRALSFAALLEIGSPTTYNAGFDDFCSNNNIEVL